MYYNKLDRKLAKSIFDYLVEDRFQYDFNDMTSWERNALSNWFLECAPHVLNDIKNGIIKRRKQIRRGDTCLVYYSVPNDDGHTYIVDNWQAALEKVTEIYHTIPRANIKIYDGKNDRCYTHDKLVAIIKDYYVVTRRTGDRDFEVTQSFLTIEGQAINAFNAWLHFDGEFDKKIAEDALDNADSVMVTGTKHDYTYTVSKHKME